MGDVVNFFSGLTYHPSDVKNKGYFVIRSSNIQNNQIVSADDIFVNKDIINVPNVKQGDIIVVVRNGSRKLIGKHAQVLTDMPNTVIGAFMTGVRSKSNFYINALLDSDQFQKEIYKNLGATINQITIGEFRKMRFIITSGNEAQTIGEFFKKIDTLITLQQRKLEILIKLKRSFLTKSMANSLDKNPELYFNSASVKWLKQKLSDLTIKEFKGNTKLNDTKPGKTEYLDAERLNGNVPLFIDKPINTLKSDILILWDGSKAGSVYYGFEGSLGSTLKAIRLNPKLVNSFFVYQQLKSKQDVIFNKYRTPNIPHVIKNFTKVYPIYFPSIAVQNKIARFLGNLDTLIEIQQKSIKDHKVIKKYLLQKLFI